MSQLPRARSVPSGDIPRGNRLLDSLPATDQADLAPHLVAVRLELKQQLLEPGERIDHVYFPLNAVGSLLNLMEDTSGVEVATVGNEGLLGLSVSWGAGILNPREVIQCQIPGEALVMDAGLFASRTSGPGALTDLVHAYTQAFVTQISQQVSCNGLHPIEERCARWLLLTHDRVAFDEFPLTYGFLAQMLGVGRPAVTVVVGVLQQAGFIRFRQGSITIQDREGLESASCECYWVLREAFDRLGLTTLGHVP
jgi:CRP-like cAMP-binding protein